MGLLNRDVARLLENQVAQEFYSGYLYLDISNYYAAESLGGFAHWFRVQAQEERDHALLFMDYLLDQGEQPRLGTIEAPGGGYKGHRLPLEAAFAHECLVTGLIHAIYDAAAREKDFRTMQFLDWFIREQGEEEKSTEDLVKRYNLFGGDPKGLYLLDTELAARVYAPPSIQ